MASRIVVEREGAVVEQGTAWFVTPWCVFTAFHVVGDCGTGRWAHDIDPRRSYRLDDRTSGTLRAVEFCARTDVALLALDPRATPGATLPLARAEATKRAHWDAEGFPGLVDGKRLTLHGPIAAVGPESDRSVQLTVAQGTDVAWAGMSGSAVLVQGQVVALLTQVMHMASTAWAAPVTALRRVANAANLELAASPPAKVAAGPLDIGALDQVDLRLLARAVLEACVRGRVVVSVEVSLGGLQYHVRLRPEIAGDTSLRDDLGFQLRMIATFEDNVRFYTEQLQTPASQYPSTRRELRESEQKLADHHAQLAATLARFLV
jgi:hypothetical protein